MFIVRRPSALGGRFSAGDADGVVPFLRHRPEPPAKPITRRNVMSMTAARYGSHLEPADRPERSKHII
ncbi:hypothetical protein GCM10023194_57350 [Planotetraspora phitsanulokensis]|uniref:Uncharacterized protein n=1 Tax=Planotetraspora phitsanulokensis TaxID=575192 RepID=A0A8J3UDZ1_9ACTN|nr:hypothetical protein Pph01_80180 [Planotetraspora phitsanulokensis]